MGGFLCSVALSAVPGLSVVAPPVGGYSSADLGGAGSLHKGVFCLHSGAMADSSGENQRFHVGGLQWLLWLAGVWSCAFVHGASGYVGLVSSEF